MSLDGPVAICEEHGEYSLHTGCLRCAESSISLPPDDVMNAMLRLDTMFENSDDTTIVRKYAEGLAKHNPYAPEQEPNENPDS